VERIAYSPNAVRDLPCPKTELSRPTVFHLLGRASASPDYAICDEDLLEFVHAMQDRQRQPAKLFDELRTNHLLILGCSFGDWLARFFLRTARGLELSQKRKRLDLLFGEQIARDERLVLFLESFGLETRVLLMSAPEFIEELGRRWQASRPESTVAAEAHSPRRPATQVPPGAVFVSYAIEDREPARLVAESLHSAGMDVWFWVGDDPANLGEDWARNIRRGVQECALFLPIISQRALSEENRRSYFWREWNYADDLAWQKAPDEVFIFPVVVDDARIDCASLPDSFNRAQGVTLPGGQVTADVAERMKQLVRTYHRRQRAA
jgi:hypothetical protein